jgi:hypothetical protein
MLNLLGGPCKLCGCMEFTQQEKDVVVCSRCRSFYTEKGKLSHVGVYAKDVMEICTSKLQNESSNSG